MVKNSALRKLLGLIKLAQFAEQNKLNSSTAFELLDELREKKSIQRRQFLEVVSKSTMLLPFVGGLGSYASAGLVSQSASNSSHEPVVILGAGTAGLVAAYRLQQAGVPSIIYEGSPRVGGRMFTLRNFNADSMFCELGGELVDAEHEDLIQICGELGIPLNDIKMEIKGVETDLFYVNGRVLSSEMMLAAFRPLAMQIAQDLERVFGVEGVRVPTYKDHKNSIIVQYDRMPLSEYLYSKEGVDSWVLDSLNVLYACEFGLEIDQQSALNFLTLISTETSTLKFLGSSDEGMRIDGGSSVLPETIAERLTGRVPIHLEHNLIKIQDTWRGFKLTFLKDCKHVEVFARKVICTIPLSILRNIEGIRTLDFPPQVQACVQEWGYGTNSKLMMGFSSRPWREMAKPSNGSLITLSQQQFWETSRGQPGSRGILTNFMGGAMGNQIPRDQLSNNLEVLDSVYPGSKRAFENERILQYWPNYQWAKGSYTCLKPGQYTRFNGLLANPQLSGRFIFAGEHVSPNNSGFMNGAVQSGNMAAQAIIETRHAAIRSHQAWSMARRAL